MTVLDTNVIVALLDGRDSLHGRAVKEITSLNDENICTINVIIAETYSVIARRCRERGHDCRKTLRVLREFESSLDIIWVEDLKERHPQITDKIIESGGKLNYNDAVLLSFIRKSALNLLTFDKELLTAKETV
ncbi:MAG: PIN domain-containing protein [Thermodesulfovibrionales bacterium]|nr:PIN domain-containing protein [Thermodesulfovibrionales bacterium]